MAKALSSPPVRSDLPLWALRFPKHLAAERALRTKLVSIQVSWKSTRSGLFAYGAFCSSFYPKAPSFPALLSTIDHFSAFFLNSDTFSAYVSHLRFGARLRGQISLVPAAEELKGLLRGMRKATVHKPKPVLTSAEILKLVNSLAAAGEIEVARLVIIGRSYMCRMQSELFPLQLDGETSALHGDDWHSRVINQGSSCSLRLRSRKNAPHGATIERSCHCTASRPQPLCGVCCLRGQMVAARGRPPENRLFSLQPVAALKIVHRHCLLLGLPLITWHSLRRGAARDLLGAGNTLAQILFAGGWRSAAFLKYLSSRDVDKRLGLELALQDSDSD